jgi:hypothetical protein
MTSNDPLNNQLKHQPSNLPVPLNPGTKAITKARSEQDSSDLASFINGIDSKHAAERIVTEGCAMLLTGSPGEDCDTALELMREFPAANVTEAMLNVQMVGTHEAAVKFLRLAMSQGQTAEAVERSALLATRFGRLYLDQLAAMAKLKGKTGQQRVTVKHVHVNAGGQAIVGQVTRNPGERGQ